MSVFSVEFYGLDKSFGSVRAISNLNLSVEQGELLAVVGPSGCGKTTLLRLLAGFEHPDSGVIRLNGRVVTGEGLFVPPEKRGVGMVFQDYALFPHMTVSKNIGFGLNGRNGRDQTILKMLELVHLGGYQERYPHELSGGERQRVALARALAPQPGLVLLDEPFSNLDADRRLQMRADVRAILKEVGITSIFVTHDQAEALFMGDRMAVINKGQIEQIGTPEQVFHQPSTRFVAGFLGQTEFIPGILTSEGIWTEIGMLVQPVDLPIGSRIEIALRADDVSFDIEDSGQDTIIGRNFEGALNVYQLGLPSGLILSSLQPHTCQIPVNTRVRVRLAPNHPLVCFSQGKRIS
jgi:iron(III) transport system ATP-binding protein